MRNVKGFTVIELLITIAVLGVLLSLAVPAFTNFINQQSVKKVAREFQAAVLQARSESVKRNGVVYLTSNGGDWADGWFVTTNAAADEISDCGGVVCFGVFAENQSFNATGIAATQVAFNRSGRPVAGPATLTFCDSGTTPAIKKYEVTIELSGFASIEKTGNCGS